MNEYFSDEAKALYCSECKAQKRSKYEFVLHFKRYHAVPDLIMRPDIHDPNLHCSSCQKTFRSKISFREHMQFVHSFNPDLQYTRLDRSLIPDAKDPDFYCKVCERNFFSKPHFFLHLKRKHGMNVYKSANLPEYGTPENYCVACDLQLPGSVSYIRHLRIEHKELNLDGPVKRKRSDSSSSEEEEPTKKKKEKQEPKPASTIPSTRAFGTVFQPGLMPDELSTEPHCILCKKDFRNLHGYRIHLHYAHKEYVTFRPVPPDNVPDPCHPYFYCSICEKRAVSKTAFHYHLKAMHYMEFES